MVDESARNRIIVSEPNAAKPAKSCCLSAVRKLHGKRPA